MTDESTTKAARHAESAELAIRNAGTQGPHQTVTASLASAHASLAIYYLLLAQHPPVPDHRMPGWRAQDHLHDRED